MPPVYYSSASSHESRHVRRWAARAVRRDLDCGARAHDAKTPDVPLGRTRLTRRLHGGGISGACAVPDAHNLRGDRTTGRRTGADAAVRQSAGDASDGGTQTFDARPRGEARTPAK